MIGRRTNPSTPEGVKPKGFDDFELRLGDVMRGERATLGKSLLDVQRELKIKATYVAAIENCDVSAFETQGFVAGYVRSYARYLGMNPDLAYEQFCIEANFTVAHGMSAAASPARITKARSRTGLERRDPLGDPNATFVPRGESLLARVEPGAVGSLLVLIGLIAGIGYGGWSVLQEVQRVQLAPVDQAPRVVAEIDPLGNVQAVAPLVRSAPEQILPAEPTKVGLAADLSPVARPDMMDRLYRPLPLEAPVMISRDGPIAAIDPGMLSSGGLAAVTPVTAEMAGDAVQVVADAAPPLQILAVRPSWVRVQSADGTVLYEKILDACERYTVPLLAEAPVLRTGNSGAIYFLVDGKAFGPAAPGAQVVKNVALDPGSVVASFAEADVTSVGLSVAVADASGSVLPDSGSCR